MTLDESTRREDLVIIGGLFVNTTALAVILSMIAPTTIQKYIAGLAILFSALGAITALTAGLEFAYKWYAKIGLADWSYYHDGGDT